MASTAPAGSSCSGRSSRQSRKVTEPPHDSTATESRSLWLSSLSQFGTGFGWVFLGTWLPDYLAQVHRVPLEERGWMTSLPWLIS